MCHFRVHCTALHRTAPQAVLSGNSHVVVEAHFAAAAARAAVVNLNTHLVARECGFGRAF